MYLTKTFNAQLCNPSLTFLPKLGITLSCRTAFLFLDTLWYTPENTEIKEVCGCTFQVEEINKKVSVSWQVNMKKENKLKWVIYTDIIKAGLYHKENDYKVEQKAKDSST